MLNSDCRATFLVLEFYQPCRTFQLYILFIFVHFLPSFKVMFKSGESQQLSVHDLLRSDLKVANNFESV